MKCYYRSITTKSCKSDIKLGNGDRVRRLHTVKTARTLSCLKPTTHRSRSRRNLPGSREADGH